MKKYFFATLMLLSLLSVGTRLSWGDLEYKTFPTATGDFYKILFEPWPAGQSPTCNINSVGTMYLDSSNELQICAKIDGTTDPDWTDLGTGQWILSGTNLTTASNNYRIGVGTQTPDLRLSIDNDGALLSRSDLSQGDDVPTTLGEGTWFMWAPKRPALRAGTLTATAADYWDSANVGVHTYVFGEDNKASAAYSTIMGGQKNEILADGYDDPADDPDVGPGGGSFIGGGLSNIMKSSFSNILGGFSNQNYGSSYSSIGGGELNKIHINENTCSGATCGNYSVIGGGKSNTIDPGFSFIGGGLSNAIFGTTPYSIIFGGSNNQIKITEGNHGGTIGAGISNEIKTSFQNANDTTDTAAIVAGNTNQAAGVASFIGAGESNILKNSFAALNQGHSVILAGYANENYNQESFVGGGYKNRILGFLNAGTPMNTQSTIVGGRNNTIEINARNSVIWGGGLKKSEPTSTGHTIETEYSTIIGGMDNTISTGNYATIGGGRKHNVSIDNYATVIGGDENAATALNATVAGGYKNTAAASQSTILGGYESQINSSGTNSIAVGEVTLWGANSFAFMGSSGLAVNIVRSDLTFAMGNAIDIKAGADNTFAFGQNIMIDTAGSDSLIIGSDFNLSGSRNLMFGSTIDNGDEELALEGADGAISMGRNLIPECAEALTIGRFNANGLPCHKDVASKALNDVAFKIGNGGDETTPRNGLVMLWNGGTGINAVPNTVDPTFPIYLEIGKNPFNPTQNILQINPQAVAPFTCDPNNVGAVYADSDGALCVCNGGPGWVTMPSSASCS